MPGSTDDTHLDSSVRQVASSVPQAASSVPHGFGDDERSRFLRTRPPAEALAWVEGVLDARVTRVQALKGGSSSAIHALRVWSSGGADSVVLRRYVSPEREDDEPDIAEREARVLRLLHDADLPTPRLIASDPGGADAGVPTILMSRLAGRVDWSPNDLAMWLTRLARVLPALHATALPPDHGIPNFRPYDPDSWAPPEWMRQPELYERAIEIFHGAPLDPECVFIHRDFHPGNVLWKRGRISGVVDWQAASVGPRSADVAWCHLNLIRQFDLDVADRFIDVWEAGSGTRFHPWAEVVMLVDVMDWRGERKRREREDLEHVLARTLAALGA